VIAEKAVAAFVSLALVGEMQKCVGDGGDCGVVRVASACVDTPVTYNHTQELISAPVLDVAVMLVPYCTHFGESERPTNRKETQWAL